MPLIKKVKPLCRHKSLPVVNSPSGESLYGEGTIYQCDECGKFFRLIEDQKDGSFFWFYICENTDDPYFRKILNNGTK